MQGPADKIERKIDLSAGWEKKIGHDEVMNCYNDLDAIWKALLKAGNINIMDTLTRGEGMIEYKGEVKSR